MIKNIKTIIFITVYFLICCQKTNRDTNFYSLIIGDWKEIDEGIRNCKNKTDYEMNKGGYTFLSDNVVDMKKAFFAYEIWDSYDDGIVDSVMYKGTFAKYEIIHDTLKIQHPKDLTWYNRKIVSISKDTMLLQGGGCLEKYVHMDYHLDTMPTFDKIIVSTSYPPLGKFPTYDVMIRSNGEAIYSGQAFTDKEGFYISKIAISEYQTMQDNFRKANINNIKKHRFTPIEADQQRRYTTFVKGHKIYKTCEGYSPIELYWATIPLENLDKTKSFQKLSENDSAFYFSNAFFQYEVGNTILDIKKSESFLLWDYLRTGKWTTKSFKKRFELGFYGYYICQPNHKLMKEYKVKKIETDGRFYKLYMVGKAPITIDIGHNFFDTNFKESSFRKKNEFD